MKNRRILAGVAGLCLISLAVSSIAIASMAAFVQKTENGGGADGDVGLRNYYQKGDGSSSDPFIISRPVHFYNFSRLQSLGVYSDPTQPKFFQLGYDPTGGNDLKFYENDASNTMINYLDMSAYDGTTSAKTIHPIGSEGFPFSGRFDGMNLQVSNLTVIGDTQDVGVFGYTSSSSRVANVMFDNLTVTCRGYDTTNFSDLFSSNVAPNIIINGEAVTDTRSVDVVNGTPLTVGFVEPAANGYTYTISAACEYLAPASNRKSLSIVSMGSRDASGDLYSIFDLFANYSGTYPANVIERISVIAHKIVDGVPTARVVSIYDASFSKASAQATIRLNVTKATEDTHGCNIGLVIGHCDGSMNRVYVHNGVLDINPEVAGYTRLPQKSEFGLIGMVGASIGNAYKGGDGTAGVEGTGVGVAHFTDIYKNIVEADATFTQVSDGIYTYTPKEGTDFDEFLRYRDENESVRYTSGPNKIALRGREVIRDSAEKDYGLGVFTIVTDTTTEGTGYSYYGDNIDNCVIQKDATQTDTIYYTTAEWQNPDLESTTQWSGDDKDGDKHIHPGYYIPDEYDSDPEYHKNLNFIFKTQLTNADNRWYFADADEETKGGSFLKEYFHSKLVDSTGTYIPKTDPRCGVMIKDRDKANIGYLDASLRLPRKDNDGGGKMHYMQDPDAPENILISRTVNFSISKNLANVTVIAKKTNSGGDRVRIGIYRVDDITGKADYLTDRNYDEPEYAMYIPRDKEFAYFDYQNRKVGNSNGAGGTFQESRYANISHSDGSTLGKLFAHTFTLPKGHYAIASSGNTECNLYYVCAQGQESGDFDSGGSVSSLVNSVDLVDFVKEPAYEIVEGVPVARFNWNSPELSRCFLSLNSDELSKFGIGHLELSFLYNASDGEFYIQAGAAGQLAQIEKISTLNYAQTKLRIHLMNLAASREQTLVYEYSA